MGVVTLARMVKLLLTVRRLANTWGVYGQRGRKIRRRGRGESEREIEIEKEREEGGGMGRSRSQR